MKEGYTYIMANYQRTVFYIGVTSDIKQRVFDHKNGKGAVFTSKYNDTDLMYVDTFSDIEQAIGREKQLKNWHRDWKINLIKETNPDMKDLSIDWFDA